MVLLPLTHWGRVTHICVDNITIIGSDNGLSPGRRQAIIWTNAGILLIRPSGTNFSEILIGNQTFSFKKIHLKMSSAKWRPFLSRPQCVNNPRIPADIRNAELWSVSFGGAPVILASRIGEHNRVQNKSTLEGPYEAKAQSCSRVHIVYCDYQS